MSESGNEIQGKTKKKRKKKTKEIPKNKKEK